MIDVLVVDDELWVTEVIRNIIDWEKEGYRIVAVLNDGIEACDAILERSPSIVLTDIRMPGMDGLSMIKKTRQAGLETQFIIISGHNDFKYAKDALEYGAAGYLLKPIDENELKDVLAKVKNILLNKQMKEKKELSLKQNLEKCVRKLKEQFFLDYFQNADAPDLDIDEINHEFALKFSYNKYRVMILSLDNIDESIEFDKISADIYEALLRNAVHQSCEEMIVIPYRNRFICILNYKTHSRKLIDKAIKSMFQQILNENSALYKFTVFLGPEENNINHLKRSYLHALNLFHCRIVLGVSSIYDDAASVKCNYTSSNLPPEREMMFRCLIEQMEIAKAKEVLGEMIDSLYDKSDKNPLIVYCGAEQLIDIIVAAAKSMGHGYAYIESYLHEKKEKLEECAAIEQLKMLLFYMLDDMENIRSNINRSKNQKIIDTVKSYIKEHYTEDISLSSLAEMVYITPNYLSELFSREAGCTFKEFMIQSRIEVAKKLLGDLQYKTNDIATMVGYADPVHFSKLFKKYTRLTPSEYRKLFF